MILTVTPNPAVDKTIFLDRIVLGSKHRNTRYTCIPGGKGVNVSRAVKALGGDTKALIIAGGPPGQHVVNMIENDDGVPCIPIWVRGMTRTITTVLEESVHRQTPFFEPGPVPTGPERELLLNRFREVAGEATVVTFNGAVQDDSLQTLYRDCIAIAHEAGAYTILDSYGPEFEQGLEARPTMVKPNRDELAGLVGEDLSGQTAQWRAVDWLHRQGVLLVVLSLGADGALVSRDGQRLVVRPPAIREVNPVGSGDALVAGFALGLAGNEALESMARQAVAAGAANAKQWDIGYFNPSDVLGLMKQVTIEQLDS